MSLTPKSSFVQRIASHWPSLFGIGFVLAFALTITGADLEYVPGDLGDARFNMYVLEHMHQVFTGVQESIWEAPFMYPEEKVITYSDNHLGSAPFYSIFRVLNFDRETSFQLWFIAMSLLNFGACYAFLKWYFKDSQAATIGAIVFAASLALQSQITHAQVFARFAIPLLFWMCVLFYRTLKPIYLLGAVVAFIVQFYCGMYLGVFLTIPFIFMIGYAFVHRHVLLKEYAKETAWVLSIFSVFVVSIALIYPLLNAYIQRSANTEHPYVDVFNSMPLVRDYLFVQDGSLWPVIDKWAHTTPNFWDHQLFPGLLSIAALLAFFYFAVFKKKQLIEVLPNNRPSLKMITACAAITMLLFVRISKFSFIELFVELPGFQAIRSFTRVINIQLFFFAFASSTLTLLILKKARNYSSLLFIGIVLLLFVDNRMHGSKSYRFNKQHGQARVQHIAHKMTGLEQGSIISYEPAAVEKPIWLQLDAMLACQNLGMKCINGYSATSPGEYHRYWRELSEAGRQEWATSRGLSPESIITIK